MKKPITLSLILAITAFVLGLWLVTGRHAYTKFEVVEKAAVEVSTSDPLAATGFYDDGQAEVVVHKKSFHLGFLPTPRGLLDKHAFSVVSVLGPTWGLFIGVWCLDRRKSITCPI